MRPIRRLVETEQMLGRPAEGFGLLGVNPHAVLLGQTSVHGHTLCASAHAFWHSACRDTTRSCAPSEAMWVKLRDAAGGFGMPITSVGVAVARTAATPPDCGPAPPPDCGRLARNSDEHVAGGRLVPLGGRHLCTPGGSYVRRSASSAIRRVPAACRCTAAAHSRP